eukprot:581951-Prymnesium_polylepis.1
MREEVALSREQQLAESRNTAPHLVWQPVWCGVWRGSTLCECVFGHKMSPLDRVEGSVKGEDAAAELQRKDLPVLNEDATAHLPKKLQLQVPS